MKIGVIGTGILGSRHARVWHELPDTELVAVCDLDAARVQNIAQQYNARAFTDYNAMLAEAELDAVSVATPDHLHRAPVLAALAAGKHVLQEKPLATNAADARAIVDAAEKSRAGFAQRVVMVNFSQRFVTDHIWLHDAIARGDIGKPRMVISIKHDNISVPTGMIRTWAQNTSPLYFMSSHDLDLVHWFLGADPVSVMAQETRGTLDAQGIPVHDGLNALIQFGDNVIANFHSSWIHPNTYPRIADGFLQIIGDAGALTYTNRTRTAELYNARGGQKIEFTGVHTADIVDGKIKGAFVSSLQHFLECVRTGREPDTSPRRVLATALAQAGVRESLREVKAMRVE
ncbi:MAG: Gfo/Idh/MocA family oxidoreductase [Chloroflexi bacterium]|nr:Gfo/Idh/MocA family oxidoreductase [Chloroflexota bacterium]